MSERSWTIIVPGKQQPAGSKQAYPIRRRDGSIGASVVDDNPKSRDWKAMVADQAHQQYRGPILQGGVLLRIEFSAPRPKSHYGTGRNAGILKSSAPRFWTTRPDDLKLARGTTDALTGIVWRDDSQIVRTILVKAYAQAYSTEITVRDLELY